MTRVAESYFPYMRENGGFTTLQPMILSGSAATLDIGGTGRTRGVHTFDVSPVFTAGIAGQIQAPVIQSALVGATVAVTAAQSGYVFQNRSTSGSPSWTLPTCANGLEYTFTCANTTTGFTVTGAQVIHAKTSATGTAITTTTTLTNTQATAVVGDSITIVGDGTAWWMIAQSGVFAAS